MAPPSRDPARQHWQEIARALQALTQLHEWDVFLTLATARAQEQLERLATVKDRYEYEQGVLEGMRRLLALPQALLAQARRP